MNFSDANINSPLLRMLCSDPIRNISVLGFNNNFKINQYIIKNQCAIVFGKSDQLWTHLIGNSEKDLGDLIKSFKHNSSYYYSVEDWMIPLILEDRELEWIMTTHRYIFNATQRVTPPKFSIESIDKKWAPYIFEHSNYQSFTSVEYIEERLSNDISAAIFYSNKPIAWALAHDDGALGFLHVIENWRNKGLATDIMKAMIQKRRINGKVPFCNVVKGNELTENLTCKLGFTIDRAVSWIKVKC